MPPLLTGIPMAANRRYSLDETFFDSINTELKAYWLGFLSADGSVHDGKQNKRLAFNLHIQDEGHLIKLAAAFGTNRPVRRYTRIRKDVPVASAYLSIDSPHMVQAVAGHGIGPRKSLTLKPWSGPPELMPHFWRGVFDGDGCIHERESGYWLISLVGSPFVVDAFRLFVSSVTGRTPTATPAGRVCRVQVGGLGLPRRVVEVLYAGASVYLDRKKEQADRLIAEVPRRAYDENRDWSWLPLDYLEDLHAHHGSWEAVSKNMLIPLSSLMKRLGRLR